MKRSRQTIVAPVPGDFLIKAQGHPRAKVLGERGTWFIETHGPHGYVLFSVFLEVGL